LFFANGNIRIEKLVKNRLSLQFRYYFANGRLNYTITYHDKNGITCNEVFTIDGEEMKGYKLVKGTGKIFHFNANGKGGQELVFKNHELVKEKKIDNK
jgi:antitoxin component YwqK of YwqJK toxin-antitoxin module